MTLYTATIILILLMDPLGNIPVFLSVLNRVEPTRHNTIILRETCFAYLLLVLFLLAGRYIMQGLGLTESALDMAGGIILFLIAIKMIFPPPEEHIADRQAGEPFIVPLAIPMIAGPSTLAMVLLFSTQYPAKIPLWFAAITLASAITCVILLFSNPLRRLLKAKGLSAMERLMGMLLTVMAVQMFLNGLGKTVKTMMVGG